MSPAPLVSVVIPTYNRAELLRQAVDSVLGQTYRPIELIVVDDGSTDRTPALLEQYAGRLRVLRQHNQGGTAARNAGARAATGEFITFLDHDDVMLPEKIERQVGFLMANARFSVVHCRWYFVDPKGKRLTRIGMLPEGDVFRALILGCFIWSGGPLMRRECLTRLGLFDEAIWSSDWDMWVRLARVYRFGCVQVPLGEYRILPDSTMADVARTEDNDSALFDKVFADPDLPPSFAATRPQALANWRFWLSRRYYALGRWDDAKRNWTMAATLWPELTRDADAALPVLCNEALDVRVADALAYITGVFDHLPGLASHLAPHRDEALARVRIGLALRSFGEGDVQAANDHLRRAMRLHPPLSTASDAFAAMAFDWAMRLPVDPIAFMADVYGSLPSDVAALLPSKKRALSDATIGQAFEDYHAGRRAEARARILSVVRSRPGVMRNRGVVAVLLRSLLSGGAVRAGALLREYTP